MTYKYLQRGFGLATGFVPSVAAFALVASIAPPAAGIDPKPSESLKEEGRKVLGRDAGQSETKPARTAQWCIALASIRGPDRDAEAAVALQRVQTEGKLPAAYLDRRNNSTVIALGRYAGPEDAAAQADLERVRAIVVNNLLAYSFAFLCPPEVDPREGAKPEYNLARAKELYGDDAVQTLQVAVYGREEISHPTEKDLAETRRAAEIACVRLRQDGELAFYHHGTRRSMVTIGVFDVSDFDPQTPSYHSARLMEIKRRHPYNLYNGAAIREKRPGQKEGRLQPSSLVKIPDAPAPSLDAAPTKPGKADPTRR